MSEERDKEFSSLNIRALANRFAKQTSVYGIGYVFNYGVAFLLMPVYLACLSPAEFGILSLARIAPSVVLSLMTLDLSGAIVRFFYEWKKNGQEREALFTIWLFSILWAALISALCIFFGEKLFEIIFTKVAFDPYVRLAILAETLTVSSLISNKLLRSMEMAKTFSVVNIFNVFLTLSITIYFVAYLDAGVTGALKGAVFAAAVMMFLHIIILAKHWRMRFVLKPLKESLNYTVPLVPGNITKNMFGLLDRFLIDKFVPAGEIGLYAVARQIASIVKMAGGVLQLGMAPLLFRAATERPDYKVLMATIYKFYFYILFIVSVSLYMYASELMIFIGKSEYFKGVIYIAPMIVVCFIEAMFALPSIQISIAKKTKYESYASVLMFIIFSFFGYYLTNKYHVSGMIVAYCMAYALGFFFLWLFGQKLTAISLDKWKIAFVGLLGVVTITIVMNTGLVGSNHIDINVILIKTLMIIACFLIVLEIEFNWVSSKFNIAKSYQDE